MVSARGLALHALVSLERGRGERLRPLLDGRGVVGRDLAFAYELAHGTIRRERLLDFVLAGFAHRGLPRDPTLRIALRLGAYQLLFVPGMPAHAAVHESVALVRNNRGFANAILRKVAQAILPREADPEHPDHELPLGPSRALQLPHALPDEAVARGALLHSLPDWLAARMFEQHGAEGFAQIAVAASATPSISLRVSATTTPALLQQRLAAEDVVVQPTAHPELLRWTDGQTPFATAAFADGDFVVQDETALRAVDELPVAAGDRVLDLCAAPGTKTTRLAERVAPGGRVFAFDPDPRRRGRIGENVARLRLEQVVDLVSDPAADEPYDHVLADVPCSNTGVLGRRVEVRRRLTEQVFDELPQLQLELLQQALRLTRPGGHVVYSTCSVDRDENRAVVDRVLTSLADGEAAVLLRDRTTLPEAGSHDGGYVAVLQRR